MHQYRNKIHLYNLVSVSDTTFDWCGKAGKDCIGFHTLLGQEHCFDKYKKSKQKNFLKFEIDKFCFNP